MPVQRIVHVLEIENKQYAIVDTGDGGFVDGVYARFLVTPMACIDKNIPDEVKCERVE